MVGFTRSGSNKNLRMVMVTDVNAEGMIALAVARDGGEVRLSLESMPSGVLSIPAPGERWIAEYLGGRWVLRNRLPFQDSRVREARRGDAGDVYLGSSGRTVLSGSKAVLPEVLEVGEQEIRLTEDGQWEVRRDDTWGLMFDSGTPPPSTVPFSATVAHSRGTRTSGLGESAIPVAIGRSTVTDIEIGLATADGAGTLRVQAEVGGAVLYGAEFVISAGQTSASASGSWPMQKGASMSLRVTSLGSPTGSGLWAVVSGTRPVLRD